MSRLRVKLCFDDAEVEGVFSQQWSPDLPRVMANGIIAEFPDFVIDLCEQLVEEHKRVVEKRRQANERAREQMDNDPRSCQHLSWSRDSTGRAACIKCGAYLD